jgi:hypothetical protein
MGKRDYRHRRTTSSANSLINFPNVLGGGYGVFSVAILPNGNYVVINAPGSNATQGNTQPEATWVDGATGTTLDGQNTPDAQNSLYGGGGGVTIQPISSGSAFVFTAAGDNSVTVAFTDPNQLSYALGQGQPISVTPAFITRTLDTGANVTVQADDNLTISSPITETPSGTAGSLTLDAGRSILLNAGISTVGGNLSLIANDTQADGVVDSQRGPGNAAITMASGVTLNTGSGALLVDLKNSTDKTNNGSGGVTLLGVGTGAAVLSSASTLGVTINGTTPGDGVTAGTYTQTNVTGPINLNGASLQITHTAATAGRFTIVQTTGGVTGTFNGLNEGAVVHASDGTPFTISYQGDGGNAVVLSQVVVNAATTTAVSSSANPSAFGNSVTLTATVTDTSTTTTPTGTVEFFNGNIDLGSGTALSGAGLSATSTFITSTLPIGSDTIKAVYTPTGAFVSSSGTVKQVETPVVVTAVLKSDGSLWQYTTAGGMQLLSAAGAIRAISTVLDGHGQTDIFAITTGLEGAQCNNTLWEYASGGWSQQSSGAFSQISAATDSAGQSIVFGLLTNGSLWEQSHTRSLDAGWGELSGNGTIKYISAITDAAGNDHVYVIVTRQVGPLYTNTLWEHIPTGWRQDSSGAFSSVSAGLNSAGQAVAYAILTNGSLWEQNPAFGTIGLDLGWNELSGVNNLPMSFRSVQAAGPDEVFGIAQDQNTWEHTPTANTELTHGLLASQLRACAKSGLNP